MISFLHGPSDGTLSILILRSSCHTLCNWMASLQCDSLHVILHLICKSSCNIWYTAMVSSFHGFFSSSDSPSSLLILRRSCHNLCNWMFSLQYDSLHESSPDVEKLLSLLVHFNGCFLHGSSDYYCKSLLEALATLNAPVWLLSSVIPFMNPHLMWKSSWDINVFFPSWTLSLYFLLWSWEALVTLYTIEWLLSSVIPFMLLHLMWKSSSHIWCTSMVESFSHIWCTWIPSVYFSKLMSSTYKKLQYHNSCLSKACEERALLHTTQIRL